MKVTELISFEILVVSGEKIQAQEFNKFKQKPNFKTVYVDQFSDDLWKDYTIIEPSKENAERIINVLNEFGFGSCGITESAFLEKGTAVTLGSQPNQIDLLTSVSQVSTHEIFKNAKNGQLEDFNILYISKNDLIKCKNAVGRLKDLADVEELEKIGK
jgi:cell division septum initiation protein DivIVA